MKKRLFNVFFPVLLLIATITLTACSIKKPEVFRVQSVYVDSITTVCKTECDLSDVDVSSGNGNCSTSYKYSAVANNNGKKDAKTYYDYLKASKLCAYIEPFDEKKGFYTAYILGKVEGNKVSGFTMKISFTSDSYTVTMTDNLIPDNIPNYNISSNAAIN